MLSAQKTSELRDIFCEIENLSEKLIETLDFRKNSWQNQWNPIVNEILRALGEARLLTSLILKIAESETNNRGEMGGVENAQKIA